MTHRDACEGRVPWVMIEEYNGSRDSSFGENTRNVSSRPEGLYNKTSTFSAGESSEDAPQAISDATAARTNDDASRIVPPFELAGPAPESPEGGERMRAVRSLLSVGDSLNGARDQAHETTPDWYDDAGDDTRRSVTPRSDGDVNDNGASTPPASRSRASSTALASSGSQTRASRRAGA